MKRSLLLFAGVLLATSSVFSQAITLNQAGYTSSPVGTDNLKTTTAASAFPSFTVGASQTWDLSNVTDSTATILAYHVADAVAPANFADSDFYSLGGNAYQGNVQSAIAAAGLLQYGINIQSVTYPLTAPDTIFIPAQNSTFTATHTVIKFPATMSSSWSSTYESDFNYNITYNPPLYVHAPGIVKSYVTEKDSVIGWGQMRVKTLAGVPSGYMNVLQVRTMTTTTDSFYLNGGTTDPAIGTLLTLLGYTQGQVTKTYVQNFYRINEITPLASVTFSDSANTTPTNATTHMDRLATVGVANVFNNADIKIYPNPVTGHVVSIDVPAASGEWKYELVNISGQTVAADILQLGNTQTHTQVQLSATLNPGIYYIRLINDGRQVVVKPLEIK